MRRDGVPVSRPRVDPQNLLSKQPLLSPHLLLEKLSVHLILLQFHLSPHKPSSQHPLCFLKNIHIHSSSHFPHWTLPSLFFFFPSPDLRVPPPTTIAFQGCVFHALVAGQALGDFPRWGLNFGQERAVWSDVRAEAGICVFVCALSLHMYVSACVGVYSLNSLQKASCTNGAPKRRGVELTSHTRHPFLLHYYIHWPGNNEAESHYDGSLWFMLWMLLDQRG